MGKPNTKKSYEESLRLVYGQMKAGYLKQALSQMIEKESGRLKGVFRCDGNHSWYVVGDCYVKLGQREDAISAFRRSLRGWSDDPQAIWALGNCYSEVGKHWLAERYFRRALSLLPENQSIRFNLANALFDQGKFNAAISEYLVVEQNSRELSAGAQKNIQLAKNRLRENKPKGSG